MKSYRVILSPTVQDQIWEQVKFIAVDSIDHALNWEDRLRREVLNLGTMPRRYPVNQAASERSGEPVRKMVFERTYLLFYRINLESRSVEILNFRHGARLPRANEP